MTTWHQSGLSTQFLARRRAEPLLSLQDRVTAACQDEDWEVRQSALEWCHALVAHAEWQQLFELNADVVLHHAVSTPVLLLCHAFSSRTHTPTDHGPDQTRALECLHCPARPLKAAAPHAPHAHSGPFIVARAARDRLGPRHVRSRAARSVPGRRRCVPTGGRSDRARHESTRLSVLVCL